MTAKSNIPAGFEPVEGNKAGRFIKLTGENAKKGDFVRGLYVHTEERESKFNEGKMETLFYLEIEDGKFQDKEGKLDSFEKGETVIVTAPVSLVRDMSQVQLGSLVHIEFDGKVKSKKGFSVNTFKVYAKQAEPGGEGVPF